MNSGISLKRLFGLISVDIKQSMNQWGVSSATRKKKGKTRSIMLNAFIIICMLPMMFLLGKNAKTMTDILTYIGAEDTFVSVSFMFGIIIIFVMTLAVLPISYYFSGDLNIYSAMPIRGEEILASKFCSLILQSYLVIAVCTLPMAIGNLVAQFSVRAIIGWIIGMLTLPILPLILMSLIVVVLIRVLPFLNNKSRMMIFSGIVAFLIMIPLEFMIIAQGGNSSISENIANGAANHSETLGIFSVIFPTVVGTQKMVSGVGALSFIVGLAITLGTAILATFMYIFLFGRLYFKGFMRLQSTGAGQQSTKVHLNGNLKYVRKKSAFNALVSREIKSAFRVPSYFLNGVMGAFLLPICMIVGGFIAGMQNGGGSLSENIGYLREILEPILNLKMQMLVGMVLGAGIGFTSGGMNLLSSTAFSRDARHLDFLKTIPVQGETIVFAKMMPGIILSFFTGILLLSAITFVIGFRLMLIIPYIIAFLIGSYLINLIDILVDMIRPKLIWNDENAAIKGNFNSFTGSILGIVLTCIIIVIGRFLNTKIDIYLYVILIIIFMVAVILSLIIKKKATKMIKRMGEE